MNGNGSVGMIEEIVERVLGTEIEGEVIVMAVSGWVVVYFYYAVVCYQL